MICGACGADVATRMNRVLHHELQDGGILCSTTAKRTMLYTTPGEVPAPEDPLDVARREFDVVREALAYHAGHEDTPCEVMTEGGWMDVTELVEALGKALGR